MRFLVLFIALLSLTGCSPKEQPSKVTGDSRTTDAPDPLFVGQQMNTDAPLTTIALGSCNRQDEPQKMWPFVLDKSPDLWIWLGDNIYGDTEDMSVMLEKYRMQKFGEAYTALRNQTQVIGIWDDHDYGVNDGGKEYPMRDTSKALMLDFLDVPKDAAVRQRPGGYQAYTFGPAGQKTKIILLDTRYFRDPLDKSPEKGRRYLPNTEGDILGEAQWSWLEEQLNNSDAQVHIIGSSIQILSAEHGYEKWANFPKSRQRLFDLLQETQPARTVLLSGDRHISELSKIDLEQLDYPLYELTSSGMTHTWSRVGDEPNQYRVSDLIAKLAYGLIRIDWSEEEPVITLEVNGLEGHNYLTRELPL